MATKKRAPKKTAAASDKRAAKKRAADDRAYERRTGKKRRHNVQSRHFDGGANWTKLINADEETWKYVLAYMDSESGAPFYRDAGYEECLHEPGGVRFGAGKVATKIGEPLIMKGMLLMRIRRDELVEGDGTGYDNIVEYGMDGQTGQADADEVEKRIMAGEGVESLLGHQLGEELRYASEPEA